jgi:aconitate hydratase
MAPEYGATMGFFGTDEKTLEYFRATGRSEEQIETIKNYYEAQGMFGIPQKYEVDYSTELNLDLATITPSVAGPKRPQDRIELPNLDDKFIELFGQSVTDGGYGKNSQDLPKRFPVNLNTKGGQESEIGHGDVLIAAITSCTNTSNPAVMLAAGIVAKKAVDRGLKVPSYVKTSLAPGSRVVTQYLEKTGLQKYLNEVGFNLVGYGCTVCIGNSGPLDPGIEEAIVENDLVAASVLSGNRNFEARVHQNIKANFLMSPPLVVAFALAGTVLKDVYLHPIGQDTNGNDVFLKDIWASLDEVRDVLQAAFEPETYKKLYSEFAEQNPLWNSIPSSVGQVYEWDRDSTYIQEPPFFEDFSMETGSFADIKGARALAIFGDSVTTDHISPAGAIKPSSPAGLYLQELGVPVEDFNSYGSRRGNDRVMLRGTFANVRIKNLMVAPVEGGFTKHQPSGEDTTIYDAAMKYKAEGVPTIIFGGQEYGTGSSRDWAAKGTRLMGVKAVITQSFERIHRSNLVGMGVLPLQFKEGQNAQTLNLDGTETFDLIGLESGEIKPRQDVTLRINRADGTSEEVALTLRIDTPIEIEYYKGGGILPYVLRQLLS